MSKNTTTTTTDEANVSRLAYQLWERAGRPSGRDLEFWLTAEAKVRVAVSAETATVIPALAAQAKTPKPSRSVAGTRKTWPKPYPALPKF